MEGLHAKFELEFRADGALIVKTGDQVATIGTKATLAKSRVDLLAGRLDRLGMGLTKASRMTGRLTMGLTALLAGLGYALKKAVEAAAEVESVHTRLLTVYKGNQEMADSMLAWAKEFAASTPYQLEQVSSATATLEMLGLSAKRWLPMVGDLAAAMGKDLEETAMGVGRAVSSGGASLSILSRSYAITAQQLKAAGWSGEQSAEALGNALERLLKSGRTAGGMERLSHTFEGLVSNLKDQVFMLLSEVGQPLLEILKEDIAAILARIEEMKRTGEWDKWIKRIGDFLQRFLAAAKEVGVWLGKLLVKVVEFIDKNPGLANFAVKLATIGPIAGSVTTAVLRMSGAAVKLASSFIKATKEGGALAKIGTKLGASGGGAGWVGAGAVAGTIALAAFALSTIVNIVTSITEAEARRAESEKALAGVQQAYNQVQKNQLERELSLLELKQSIFGADQLSARALAAQHQTLKSVNREEQVRLNLLKRQAEAGGQGVEGARLELSRIAMEAQNLVGFGEAGLMAFLAQNIASEAETMAAQGNIQGLLDLSKWVSSELGGQTWAPEMISYLQEMTKAADSYSSALVEAGKQGLDILKYGAEQKTAMDEITRLQQALVTASGAEKDSIKEQLATRIKDLETRSQALRVQAQLLEKQLEEARAIAVNEYLRHGVLVGEGRLQAMYEQLAGMQAVIAPDLSFDTTNEVTNETTKTGDNRPAIQIKNDYRYITVQRAVLDLKRGTEDEVIRVFSELASAGAAVPG